MVICGAKKNSTISEISLNLIPDIFLYKYNNRIGDLLSFFHFAKRTQLHV